MKRRKLVLKMTTLAILMALSIILKKFSIDTGYFRISLFDTPLLLAGMIAGPIWGMIIAFISDLLYNLLSGFAYSFIMMFSAVLWGLAGGIFYKLKLQFIPLLIVVFFISILTTTINSVQLYLWYGAGSLFSGLPLRISTMIIKWPITTILVYTLYYRVVKVLWKDKKQKNIITENNDVVNDRLYHRKRTIKI